jgi:hypothetical protein
MAAHILNDNDNPVIDNEEKNDMAAHILNDNDNFPRGAAQPLSDGKEMNADEDDDVEPDDDVSIQLQRPIAWLTFDELPSVLRQPHNLSNRIICPSCRALNFVDELSRKRKKNDPDSFAVCCSNGKVIIDEILNRSTPQPLKSLLADTNSPAAKSYAASSRAINNAFQLGSTVTNAKLHTRPLPSSGQQSVIIQGSLYHYIGPLVPAESETPRSAQLYFLDEKQQYEHRLGSFESVHKAQILSVINTTLNTENILLRTIKTAKQLMEESAANNDGIPKLRIALSANPVYHADHHQENLHQQRYILLYM